MAYVKVGSHGSATACLTYGQRKDGMEREGVVVGGVNCRPDSAKQEFKAVRYLWDKENGVQAHTVIQSFDDKDKISMEKANEIGQEMAKRLAPGHQAVVFTHNDGEGGKIHNHIVINSVNSTNGKKLESHGLLYRSRQVSNDISKELGLHVIKERTAELRYTQAERALAGKNIQPWKDEIREVIDHAKRECRNVDEFKNYLEKHGITINERNSKQEKSGKSWTYYHPDGGKVRGSKLGNDYSRDGVVNSLSMEREQGQETALEKVEQGLSAGSTLDKALELANQSAEKEQEKFAALDMKEQEKLPDDWKYLSEMEKDDLTHDLSTIDDYGIGR